MVRCGRLESCRGYGRAGVIGGKPVPRRRRPARPACGRRGRRRSDGPSGSANPQACLQARRGRAACNGSPTHRRRGAGTPPPASAPASRSPRRWRSPRIRRHGPGMRPALACRCRWPTSQATRLGCRCSSASERRGLPALRVVAAGVRQRNRAVVAGTARAMRPGWRSTSDRLGLQPVQLGTGPRCPQSRPAGGWCPAAGSGRASVSMTASACALRGMEAAPNPAAPRGHMGGDPGRLCRRHAARCSGVDGAAAAVRERRREPRRTMPQRVGRVRNPAGRCQQLGVRRSAMRFDRRVPAAPCPGASGRGCRARWPSAGPRPWRVQRRAGPRQEVRDRRVAPALPGVVHTPGPDTSRATELATVPAAGVLRAAPGRQAARCHRPRSPGRPPARCAARCRCCRPGSAPGRRGGRCAGRSGSRRTLHPHGPPAPSASGPRRAGACAAAAATAGSSAEQLDPFAARRRGGVEHLHVAHQPQRQPAFARCRSGALPPRSVRRSGCHGCSILAPLLSRLTRHGSSLCFLSDRRRYRRHLHRRAVIEARGHQGRGTCQGHHHQGRPGHRCGRGDHPGGGAAAGKACSRRTSRWCRCPPRWRPMPWSKAMAARWGWCSSASTRRWSSAPALRKGLSRPAGEMIAGGHDHNGDAACRSTWRRWSGARTASRPGRRLRRGLDVCGAQCGA
jgi:hypothetical protein